MAKKKGFLIIVSVGFEINPSNCYYYYYYFLTTGFFLIKTNHFLLLRYFSIIHLSYRVENTFHPPVTVQSIRLSLTTPLWRIWKTCAKAHRIEYATADTNHYKYLW